MLWKHSKSYYGKLQLQITKYIQIIFVEFLIFFKYIEAVISEVIK